MPITCLEPETNLSTLSNLELNSLYYVCDYIISSICKNQTLCDSCIDSAGSKTYDSTIKHSKLVSLKCYRQKTLFFVNNQTFDYFLEMNIIIRKYLPYVKQTHCNIVQFFIEKMKHIECNTLKQCHDVANKIKIRFIKFKLRNCCSKSYLSGRLNKPVFNSKTMAMHSIIK